MSLGQSVEVWRPQLEHSQPQPTHDVRAQGPSRRLHETGNCLRLLLTLVWQVEKESEKRINKYRDYADQMKVKFDEYEAQSERYYSDMLDQFKLKARDAVR